MSCCPTGSTEVEISPITFNRNSKQNRLTSTLNCAITGDRYVVEILSLPALSTKAKDYSYHVDQLMIVRTLKLEQKSLLHYTWWEFYNGF